METFKEVVIEINVILHVRLGDLLVRDWSGVFRDFAVTIPLRTSYLDRLVRDISRQERSIVTLHSQTVAILEKQRPKPDVKEAKKVPNCINMALFQDSGQIKFAAMDTIEPLTKNKNLNKLVIVINDMY